MRVCLTVISRTYCHLCHAMEVEARPLVEQYGCDLQIVDVDADPGLLRLYDERVPVLLHEDEVLSEYILDIAKVRDYLNKIS